MSEQTLTGRALDAAVHHIITGRESRQIQDEYGAVWKDENTWTTVHVYSLYRYPAVLDWLAGQGANVILSSDPDEPNDCRWECEINGCGKVSIVYAATPGEAVCRAVLQWKGKQ